MHVQSVTRVQPPQIQKDTCNEEEEEEGGHVRILSPTVKRRPNSQAVTLKSGPPTTWWVSAAERDINANANANASANSFNTAAIVSS